MSVFYDRQQITAWLDPYTVSKARDYANAISELRWIASDTLAGLVQGTRSRPYDVRVYFHDVGEDMLVEGECTCPVEVGCKHMAALLIAGLAHLPKQAATGVRPDWAGSRASGPDTPRRPPAAKSPRPPDPRMRWPM